MHMGLRCLTVAAVAALCVPIATAQVQTDLSNPNATTPSTLYFHIFDTFNAFPINTQPMNVSFFEVGGTSFPTIASQGYDFNTIYGFSTSGPVEYDFIENGRPRFHPERGIASDVQLDTNVQPVVHLYLDVRDLLSVDSIGCLEAVPGAPADVCGMPNVLPSFTMRVTMRTGNVIGSDLDSGQLIMAGQKTAHVYDSHVAGAPAAPVPPMGETEVLTADSEGIVEFAIPMTIDPASGGIIPKADSFNVRIDWYQNPTGQASQDDQFAEGWVRLVSNANHMPRLEMAIMNPVYISFIHPQVAAGLLLIHMGVNSPWGTYDVDVNNITVNVEGPDAPQDLQLVVSQNAHVHGLHDKDAEITYLWKFRDEKADNGEYAINVAVPNVARSATATGTAGFILEGQKAFGIAEDGEVVEPAATESDGKDSPGAGPIVAGLALLGAALVLRRRA